jgi:hypothetical protein
MRQGAAGRTGGCRVAPAALAQQRAEGQAADANCCAVQEGSAVELEEVVEQFHIVLMYGCGRRPGFCNKENTKNLLLFEFGKQPKRGGQREYYGQN